MLFWHSPSDFSYNHKHTQDWLQLFLFSYYLFLFVVGTGMHPCEHEYTTKSSRKRDVTCQKLLQSLQAGQ